MNIYGRMGWVIIIANIFFKSLQKYLIFPIKNGTNIYICFTYIRSKMYCSSLNDHSKAILHMSTVNTCLALINILYQWLVYLFILYLWSNVFLKLAIDHLRILYLVYYDPKYSIYALRLSVHTLSLIQCLSKPGYRLSTHTLSCILWSQVLYLCSKIIYACVISDPMSF